MGNLVSRQARFIKYGYGYGLVSILGMGHMGLAG